MSGGQWLAYVLASVIAQFRYRNCRLQVTGATHEERRHHADKQS